MFRMVSDRGLIVPQHEHARVSGVIAALWGNDRFQPAPLPAGSFLAGVDQHDRAYGLFDSDQLLAMGAERWCAVTRRGIGRQTDDPVLDLVVNLHLRRLTDAVAGPLEAALAADLDAEIAAQQAACEWAQWRFARADAITDLCDRISFALSFDAHYAGGGERPSCGVRGCRRGVLRGAPRRLGVDRTVAALSRRLREHLLGVRR